MDKRHAFILALLLALLIASNFYLFSYTEIKREKAIVGRVIDGDTIELDDGRNVRLLNVNAPEKNFANSVLATEIMKSFENKTLEFEITGMDKYKRYLARIYSPEYVNLNLVKLGYASKFLVEDNELKDFDKAEREAIENELGIWKKSEFYGCFEFDIDEKNEIIEIRNKCEQININGWMIKDESRKTFVFPDIEIGKVNLHSVNGENNSTDLFWNAGNVWNDDRDSLYLFNEKLEVAGYESYGY